MTVCKSLTRTSAAGKVAPGERGLRARLAWPVLLWFLALLAVDGRRTLSSRRVLIADRHAASRFGIRLSLERSGFSVAEAATGADAAALAASWHADVCLLDLHIPGGAIAAIRTMNAEAPETAVVMLSASDDQDDLVDAILAGARGYLIKRMNPERLPVVVRRVLAGESVIPRAFGTRLLNEIRMRGPSAAALVVGGRMIRLTPRESQVIELMRGDLSTREIGARLGISQVTVRRHFSTAARKLKASDREAALRVTDDG